MDNSRHFENCFSATQALCNICGVLCDAKIVFVEDQVHLVKWCKHHGESRTLISSNINYYLNSLSYIKPGSVPLSRAVEEIGPCPGSCGLCPRHQQHTCLPILEITSSCNLSCPICLVEDQLIHELSVSQVESIVNDLLRYEKKLNMLNISGGEPTCHPNFLEILDVVQRPEIGLISVSTNGILLLENELLIQELRDRGIVISLQFDGFSENTYGTLRGQPKLASQKIALIEKILKHGAHLSLTVTLAKDVNEHELQPILELFFKSDQILGLMIQPLAHTGRLQQKLTENHLEVITIPDVIELLAESSSGILKTSDFTPLPCSHPTCFALTYLLKTDDNVYLPLPSILPTEEYLDIIKNQALFSTDNESLSAIQQSLYSLWSSDGIIPEKKSVLKAIRKILLDLNSLPKSDSSHKDMLSIGMKNVKSIFIHNFMDRASFDISRAVKCCNHYPKIEGTLLPACMRNNMLC